MVIKNDISKDEEYRKLYIELGGEPIPKKYEYDLASQIEFERFFIYAFLKGYAQCQSKFTPKVTSLKYQLKVKTQRIRGLEAMLNDKNTH